MEKNNNCGWQEKSCIDFNFFDEGEDGRGRFSNVHSGYLSGVLAGLGGSVVINGGHFIPNLRDQRMVTGKPLQTWMSACRLAHYLKLVGKDVRLSLLVNDLPFSEEERKKLSYELPSAYGQMMSYFRLGSDMIIKDSIRKDHYTEKRLANRLPKQVDGPLAIYRDEEFNDYCRTAIVAYLEDIRFQGAEISVWILPKCSHDNIVAAINMFRRHRTDMKHFVKFETDNCFDSIKNNQ